VERQKAVEEAAASVLLLRKARRLNMAGIADSKVQVLAGSGTLENGVVMKHIIQTVYKMPGCQ
jgi:hypothetical protein